MTHNHGEHQAQRPQWTCVVDEYPWPCVPARKLLREAYQGNPMALTSHMSWLLNAASDDMGLAPGLLYKRFVRWTLDEKDCCRVCGKPGHDVVPGLPPRVGGCGAWKALAGGEEEVDVEEVGGVDGERWE
jgi:hypothetical protein